MVILIPILVYIFVVLILYTMFENGTLSSPSIQPTYIQQSLDKLNKPPPTPEALIKLQEFNAEIQRISLERMRDVSPYEVIKLSDIKN